MTHTRCEPSPRSDCLEVPYSPEDAFESPSAILLPMAAVDVVTEIVIDRPVSEVAAFAGNPDNVPRWYVNIKSVEWKTVRRVAVGSRIGFVAHFLGRRMDNTYEIIELVPGARLLMRTTYGPFPMETSYSWEAVSNERTRMTLRNRGTPTGFSVLIRPFMSVAMRRANRKDLMLLKQVLEHPSGA